ncbi:MAG: universal stress protein [Halodesulfurarchaeum sp.]
MVSHVLVPVDDSERSSEALEFAHGEYPDATITVLHVVNPVQVYTSTNYQFRSWVHNEPPEKIDELLEKRGMEVIEETLETVGVSGDVVERVVVIGNVAPSIIDYIEDNDVDMVVIGSHGRSKMSRILLGSVAASVTRRSPVPVLVYR